MIARLLVFIAIFMIGGCQSTPATPLPPNQFTFSASRADVKSAIIETFSARKYFIVNESDYQLVMDRPANDNIWAQMLLGSNFNSVPDARVRFAFAGDNPVNVFTDVSVVTNPQSGFEKSTNLNDNRPARETIQRAMKAVSDKLKKS